MSILSTLSVYVLLGIIFSNYLLRGEDGEEAMEEVSEENMVSITLVEVLSYFVVIVFWFPMCIYLVKNFAVRNYYYFTLSEEEFEKYDDEDDEE